MDSSSPSQQERPAGQQRHGPGTADGPAVLPTAPPRVIRRKPAAGRKPTLSVPVIVAAAIEVLDEAGYAGLTMRRVAERLGTGAASLYAHVSGREELLELVFDALVGQVKLEEPDPARWREQAHRLLRDFRDILASHTDAALAGLGRVPTTPQTLAAAEVLTGVLRAGGLSDRVIALGFDQLVLYVSASAYEAGLYRKADPAELERYFAGAHAFYAALPPDRYPVLASVAPDMTGADGDERFEFGLTVLIAGLEAASAAEKAKTPLSRLSRTWPGAVHTARPPPARPCHPRMPRQPHRAPPAPPADPDPRPRPEGNGINGASMPSRQQLRWNIDAA